MEKRMQGAIKSWVIWIAIVLIGGTIYSAFTDADRNSSGEVVDEGTVSAFEIQVGDCLTDTFSGDNVQFSDANAIPCSEPHAFEAYHSERLSGDAFPTDMDTIADEICYYEFTDFIGSEVDQTSLTYFSLMPTQGSWENGNDREITCIVGLDNGSSVTGTLRNSG